jgi:hypothetical protein
MVGVVFIATNHFLIVAPFLSTADSPRPWSGWSAPVHQWLKSQRSVVTATSALNVSSDVRHSSRGWSGCAPRTVREDAKNAFYRTRHLRVFLVFQRLEGLRLRPDGSCLVPDGARFSFERSVVLTHIFAVFLSKAHPSVADGPRIGEILKSFSCLE